MTTHPQQVAVELLVERRGTTYLPDAAKAQQVTDQWDVPREEVLRRVENERQGDLPHDQGHRGITEVNPGPISEDQETPGKRRTDGPEHFSLEQAAREEILGFQGGYEVELLTDHMLEEKVHMLESQVASRNQVIGDIEVKFKNYL